MTILSHWVPRLSPIFLLVSTAEKDSCPDNANAALGESSCSSSSSRLEKPLDFVALADDLLAMNQSSGNKLHEIRRVPCSGDWFFADEPIILEGCCWALESAFQKGEEVPDCSNEEDFLALDHFNISHDFFLEHCGQRTSTFGTIKTSFRSTSRALRTRQTKHEEPQKRAWMTFSASH